MQQVDAEIRRIIDQQYKLARKLLEDNRDKVEAMAKALLEWETLDADQTQRHHGRPSAAPAQAAPTAQPPPPRDSWPERDRADRDRPRRKPNEPGGQAVATARERGSECCPFFFRRPARSAQLVEWACHAGYCCRSRIPMTAAPPALRQLRSAALPDP